MAAARNGKTGLLEKVRMTYFTVLLKNIENLGNNRSRNAEEQYWALLADYFTASVPLLAGLAQTAKVHVEFVLH